MENVLHHFPSILSLNCFFLSDSENPSTYLSIMTMLKHVSSREIISYQDGETRHNGGTSKTKETTEYLSR